MCRRAVQWTLAGSEIHAVGGDKADMVPWQKTALSGMKRPSALDKVPLDCRRNTTGKPIRESSRIWLYVPIIECFSFRAKSIRSEGCGSSKTFLNRPSGDRFVGKLARIEVLYGPMAGQRDISVIDERLAEPLDVFGLQEVEHLLQRYVAHAALVQSGQPNQVRGHVMGVWTSRCRLVGPSDAGFRRYRPKNAGNATLAHSRKGRARQGGPALPVLSGRRFSL